MWARIQARLTETRCGCNLCNDKAIEFFDRTTYDETWKIGLSVPAGEHVLMVKNLVFPKGWTRPFTPLIEGAVKIPGGAALLQPSLKAEVPRSGG